ncbi:unnamed protein product [Polarella glacialis]|uniref:Kinesin light chain n=1 Tax=Polarella glacialis TaxID=89957 RepID=A0A813HE56_POLGL|nr:unnamed protein product [Polarella glacialis]
MDSRECWVVDATADELPQSGSCDPDLRDASSRSFAAMLRLEQELQEAAAAEASLAEAQERKACARRQLELEMCQVGELEGRLLKVRAGLNNTKKLLEQELRESTVFASELQQVKAARQEAQLQGAELRVQLELLLGENSTLNLQMDNNNYNNNSNNNKLGHLGGVPKSSLLQVRDGEEANTTADTTLSEEGVDASQGDEATDEEGPVAEELLDDAENHELHQALVARALALLEISGHRLVAQVDMAREAGELAEHLEQVDCSCCAPVDHLDDLCCSLLRFSLRGLEENLGADAPEVLSAANALAVCLENCGERGEALGLYRRALDGRRRQLGEEHPHSLDSGYNLAVFLTQEGATGEAEELFRRVFNSCSQVLGSSDPATLDCAEQLAALLEARADLAGAWRLRRQLLEGQRGAHGEAHPVAIAAMASLASVLAAAAVAGAAGVGAATDALCASAARHQQVLGAGHPDSLEAVRQLAFFLAGRGGDASAAEAALRSSLEECSKQLGASSSPALDCMDQLATFLESRGRTVEAEALFRRILAAREASLGHGSQETWLASHKLAVFLAGVPTRVVEAERQLTLTLRGRKEVLGPMHEDTLATCRRLAEFLAATGRQLDAQSLLKEALAELNNAAAKAPGGAGSADPQLALQQQRQYQHQQQKQQSVDPEVVACSNDLAGLLRTAGDFAGAEALYREVLAAQKLAFGAQRLETADAEYSLAVCLSSQGKDAEAEPLHRRASETYTLWHSACDPCTLGAVSNLACCLDEQDRPQEAQPLHRRVLQGLGAALGPRHPEVARAEELLSINMHLCGKPAASAASAVVELGEKISARGSRPGQMPTPQRKQPHRGARSPKASGPSRAHASKGSAQHRDPHRHPRLPLRTPQLHAPRQRGSELH